LNPFDPARNYRELVRQTYDRIAADYNRSRQADLDGVAILAPLLGLLPEGAQVLDLGCGAGVPITRALAERFVLTGIDVSAQQIALARKQVPRARFVQSDMTHCDFSAETFDAVVCFFALFHVPRDEQPELLHNIYDWLKPGGYFLATLSQHDEPGYTESDFHGAEMYWSNFSLDQYRRLLADIGFTVIDESTLPDGDAESAAVHPVVLARKPLD
jgi:SAM-dependent methyltransferase